jgi:hypothetical protein
MPTKIPIMPLRLENTYWSKGFFNVRVEFERHVLQKQGPIDIFLGNSPVSIRGRIDRTANMNRTPRIHGNKPLRAYFQQFAPLSTLRVAFESPTRIRITT